MATNSSNSNSSSAMAQLLAKHQNLFKSLHKGETVKGTLTKVNSHEILVDVGAKTEAVVLEKDRDILHTILSKFKAGDPVEVSVLNPESDFGHPVVSLRRYLSNQAWGKLEELEKNKQMIEATVSDTVKSGYIITTDFGISGYLPQLHVSFADGQTLTKGMRIKVSVLELNRKENKIIFSQKALLTDEAFAAITKQFKIGDKVKATVTNVASFGIFVTIPLPKAEKDKPQTVEGLIHSGEIAWERVDNPASLFAVGDTIEAMVNRFDSETKRILLSIKRLTEDPFEVLAKQYPIDSKVTGIVKSVDDSGVTVLLENDVEGFIRKEKIPPTVTYSPEQKITAMVSEFDKKRHRMILVPVLLEKPIGYR
jgi:ribosomal protein S1